MQLSTAKNIWTIAIWLYVMSAALNLAVLATPSAFSALPISYAALVFVALTSLIGFTSLVLVYYKQRTSFYHLFGFACGFSQINSGLNEATEWPSHWFGWSMFALATTAIPLIVAALFKQIVGRANLELKQASEIPK